MSISQATNRTAGAGRGRNAPCPCGSGRKFKHCCGLAPEGRTVAPATTAAPFDPLQMKAGGALTQAGQLSGAFSPLQLIPRLGLPGPPAAPPAPAEASQTGEEAARAYFNLARGYAAVGRIGDAIQAWRQATRLDPANHVAWQDLGMALIQIGRLPDAIGAFSSAIAAKPDFGPAYHGLGMALEAEGNATMAVDVLRQAVALSPKLADAHARIGTLMMSLSRRPEAIASLRRAAEVAPQADIGRLSLAKALMAEERQDEAIAVLRRLLARNPTNFDARVMLGDVLSYGGWFEEAEQEYQRAIKTGNQPISAYQGLVNLRKLTEADRPLVEGMRRVLQRGGLSDFLLMILHFSLGKALDDLKDYAAAMEHFDAGNRLRHRTVKLDRARLIAQFEGLIERFTPDYFARYAGLGCDDETPLLVLGMPRSGTTLTEQIISSHPAVVGGGELPYWLEAGPPWEVGGMCSLTAENARRVADDYLTMLRDHGPDAARVTDKTPTNFMWIGLIHLIFPKARIIHCKRNPIDTCLSIYATNFDHHMEFAADRGDLVFVYRQYERLMQHWQNVLPPEVYYETQYEDLVANQDVRSRELIAFCGLDWDDACLVPEQNERAVRTASLWQARQPVYKTSVERWRRYEPWLGELRELVPE
jgi:tetratricopeptide (TPR) repeat protein